MSIAFPIVPWANGTNIYEVNIRQYTKEGTFRAFAAHLPRLKDMGVEVLWLMPITPIAIERRQGSYGSYYAAQSYLDVGAEYGSKEDFGFLIRYAHELGFKVIIDWVANHTGYDHVWTKTHPHFYRKDERGEFTGLYGWVDVIDLDYEVPELRKSMIDAMKYWIETFDLDGFRCDMARTVPVDFWLEARAACDELKPLLWLAECEILNYHECFDITYGWLALRALDQYRLGAKQLSEVKMHLQDYTMYPIGSRKLLFSSNHDENSDHGTEYEKYGLAAKAVAAFSCTWPGIPLLYSGQEKPNKKRLAFFEKDEIDWTGDIELHDFYKTLFSLRKKRPALQQFASVLLLNNDHPDLIAYICQAENDKMLAIFNFSDHAVSADLRHLAMAGNYREAFSAEKRKIGSAYSCNFGPGGFEIWLKD